MDAPVCKLCKEKHWSRQPCKARPDSGPVVTGIFSRSVGKPRKVATIVRAKALPKKARRGKPLGPKQRWSREKYNAYMRALMRKKRKEARRGRAKKKR